MKHIMHGRPTSDVRVERDSVGVRVLLFFGEKEEFVTQYHEEFEAAAKVGSSEQTFS